MTPDSDAECDALLVAAGLVPAPADRTELHKAYRSLQAMKVRVRAALMWQSDTAHGFAPLTGPAADRRTAGAMDTIPVKAARVDGDR